MAIAPTLNILVLVALAVAPAASAADLQGGDPSTLALSDLVDVGDGSARCHYYVRGMVGYCIAHDSLEICVVEPTGTRPCASMGNVPFIDDDAVADLVWCVDKEPFLKIPDCL